MKIPCEFTCCGASGLYNYSSQQSRLEFISPKVTKYICLDLNRRIGICTTIKAKRIGPDSYGTVVIQTEIFCYLRGYGLGSPARLRKPEVRIHVRLRLDAAQPRNTRVAQSYAQHWPSLYWPIQRICHSFTNAAERQQTRRGFLSCNLNNECYLLQEYHLNNHSIADM